MRCSRDERTTASGARDRTTCSTPAGGRGRRAARVLAGAHPRPALLPPAVICASAQPQREVVVRHTSHHSASHHIPPPPAHTRPAGIEDLREKREELNRSVLRDEEEKVRRPSKLHNIMAAHCTTSLGVDLDVSSRVVDVRTTAAPDCAASATPTLLTPYPLVPAPHHSTRGDGMEWNGMEWNGVERCRCSPRSRRSCPSSRSA
jgi:hypothetical protein